MTSSTEVSEEKVHTPASLFFKLRNLLIEKQYLTQLDSSTKVQAGDFIEFEGQLSRKPIVETIDSMSEMMDLAEVFDNKPKGEGKGGQNNEYRVIRQQMQRFSESLKAGNTTDLTVDQLLSGHNALITVETAFLNDPLMSDLVDGKFRVLGKVVRSVDECEQISLLRKTAINKMPPNILVGLLGKMAELNSVEGFNVPKAKPHLEGPAFQIIPVAIYA